MRNSVTENYCWRLTIALLKRSIRANFRPLLVSRNWLKKHSGCDRNATVSRCLKMICESGLFTRETRLKYRNGKIDARIVIRGALLCVHRRKSGRKCSAVLSELVRDQNSLTTVRPVASSFAPSPTAEAVKIPKGYILLWQASKGMTQGARFYPASECCEIISENAPAADIRVSFVFDDECPKQATESDMRLLDGWKWPESK